jgi:hypothetical protein
MSNFFFTKASLKRLEKNQLYKMLYAQFTTPLTRGQIINELEFRIPHHTWIGKDNKIHQMWDKTNPDYKILQNSIWEIEQADLLITKVNRGNQYA